MEVQTQNQVVVVKSEKSMVVTILLTFFFGPLGMLYSTVMGGVIMIAVSVVVAVITLGFGVLITWPVCIIWAAIATSNYNKNLGTVIK